MGKSVSKLSKDDIQSLRLTTYFDKRELQQWYKGFLRDCPLGQLSEEEFVKIFKQFFPFGDPSDYCHYLFHMFDTDNSKYIDFKEFIITLSITSRGSLEQKLDWTFKLYDQRKCGEVTYDDLLKIIRATYKMIGPMIALPEEDRTPEARSEKLFGYVNKDKEQDTLKLDDFKALLKIEPTILGALSTYEGFI